MSCTLASSVPTVPSARPPLAEVLSCGQYQRKVKVQDPILDVHLAAVVGIVCSCASPLAVFLLEPVHLA